MGTRKRKAQIKKIAKLVFCVIIVGVLCFTGITLVDILTEIKGGQTSGEFITLTVKNGDDASKISKALYEDGIIKHPEVFRFFMKVDGSASKIQIGDFTVEKGSSYSDIINAITRTQNHRKIVKITFISGWTVKDFVNKLLSEGVGSADRYDQVLSGWDFGYDYIPEPGTPNRMEGFLMADTYEFYADATEQEVIKKLVENFNTKMTAAGVFDMAKEKEMSFYDALTLASIIEKEAGSVKEMNTISSVFHNRLKIKMKLQSDVTYFYNQKFGKGDEYNTYSIYGLTPTPICSPSISSVKAAINPEDTNYLYFYATKAGVTVFSRTLEEHERAIAADK